MGHDLPFGRNLYAKTEVNDSWKQLATRFSTLAIGPS